MSGTITPAGDALAWHLPARQGHRIVVTGTFTGTAPFIDLFAAESGTRLASAAANTVAIAHDVGADGDLLLRVHAPLGFTGTYHLLERSEPSMTFPVQGLTPRAVQSRFGASRDAGRRSHEGIDIFARRGTPVIAATDGFIGPSSTNRLGGQVVWIWSPQARVSTYYAHLDRRRSVRDSTSRRAPSSVTSATPATPAADLRTCTSACTRGEAASTRCRSSAAPPAKKALC